MDDDTPREPHYLRRMLAQIACTGHRDRKSVLLCLDGAADDSGVCWPCIASIAADTEISRRGVQRAIEGLIEVGVVHRHRRAIDGRQRSNLYRIDYQRLADLAPQDKIERSPALARMFRRIEAGDTAGAHAVRPSTPAPEGRQGDTPAASQRQPGESGASGGHPLIPGRQEGRTPCAPRSHADRAGATRAARQDAGASSRHPSIPAPQAGAGAAACGPREGRTPDTPRPVETQPESGGRGVSLTREGCQGDAQNHPEEQRDRDTHTQQGETAPGAGDFGVPGLDVCVRRIIAAGTALPDEPAETDEEAREQAHAAMRGHPSQAGIATAANIAARMLAGGEVTAALLEAAVQHYARASKGQSRFVHRHNWLERGGWRDALAAIVVELRDKAGEEARRSEAARRQEAALEAERRRFDGDRERDEQVREAMRRMDGRDLADLARGLLAELRERASAGDAEAKGRLMLLDPSKVGPDNRAWRLALAERVLAAEPAGSGAGVGA